MSFPMLVLRALTLLVTASVAKAHLNIFINQEEVMKLLGLSAELFYVREGVVNTYAMNFVVPVPAHISDLVFSWQSLAKNPLPYVLAIDYDNHEAMRPPQLNISSRGLIPTRVQTFRVRFPCTGVVSAEIQVLLQLNVSSHNPLHNQTCLNFRRNKICLKEEASPRNDSIRLDPASLVTSSGTFYVAVGCACAMIVVVIAITSVVYVKSKKLRTQQSLQRCLTGSETRSKCSWGVYKDTCCRLRSTTYTSAAYGSSPNVFIRLEALGRAGSVASGSYATIASFTKVAPAAAAAAAAAAASPLPSQAHSLSQPPCPYATTFLSGTATSDDYHVYAKPASLCPTYYASSRLSQLSQHSLYDPRLTDPTSRLRAVAVERSSISVHELLHEGTFGRVYRGIFRNQQVTVKTVSDQASRLQVSLLLAEGSMLHGLSHQNLLPLLAASVEARLPPLLVYPHCAKGNLKKFLQSCRTRTEDQCTLLTQDIVDIAIQLALAVIFLHSQRVCHKDIATRNCVLDEKLRVRLTDNALSRDLFPTDYYCLGDNENRPIKWLAIESLVHKQFSAASDVWAFGVLLWELTTLGQQPYVEVDPFEMSAYLRDGYRLSQPLNCPDELFTLMAWCWLSKPEDRVTFSQMLSCLQELYTALGQYI